MKKAILIAIVLMFSNLTFSQADNANSSKGKSKTVLEEISNKYGKSSSITEFLASKINQYERINKLKVLSKEEFAENIQEIKRLKQDLAKEKDNNKKASIQAKINYLNSKRVEYSAIEVELLK